MNKKMKIVCGLLAFTMVTTPVLALLSQNGVTLSSAALFSNHRNGTHVHDGNHYLALEPTCTEHGSLEYWICCACHETFLADDTEDIANGHWAETHTTGFYGDGGISLEAYLPPLGHEHSSISYYDETKHVYTCDRCDEEIEENHILEHVDAVEPTCIHPGHNSYDHCTICDYSTYVEIPATGEHTYQSMVVAPSGVRRGYTLHSCEDCDDYYYDNFDFSLYQGVTFASNANKHLIPYYFTSNYLTIEASLNLPSSHSGRGGVIVGSYGLNDCLNLEINSAGQVRLFVTTDGVVYDNHFETDIRGNNIVNIAVTIVANSYIALYIDGELVETKAITFALPVIGRKLNIGGDNRSNNAQYFKGTLYSLSIFKDIRTKDEIVNDIILANVNDADCCVSYNLIDESYLINGDDPSEDPYEYAEVDSLYDLEYHCSIGTHYINVTSDIILDRTIYAIGDVVLYSDNNSSIVRSPDFAGDMFVFGENERGRNLILDDVDCNITFGKSDATGVLTIDGNKSNIEEGLSVVGSIVYISYSASFTLEDNAVLTNNMKVGNSRTYANGHDSVNRIIGGAAVTIYSGSFTMNGGAINNCEVNDTDLSGGDDTDTVNYRVSTYGGAIFNYGNFYMNGGTISTNHAYYGAALANYGVAFINKGIITNNTTTYAGGAIYMVGQTHAQLYIGTDTNQAGVYDVVFTNNSTASMGGALYAGVWCNTMIYGSVKFENNHASGRGGAVSVNGFIEIRSNTLFKDNYSSNKGGAMSVYYDESSELTRRECAFAGVTFTGNSGTGGGALYTVGGKIDLINCNFNNNRSSSNHGGAVYIDPTDGLVGADISFTGCNFSGNEATTEAGAIFVDKVCDVDIINSSFTSNSCSTSGGALSAHGANLININNSSFESNSASSGGALYLSVRTVTVDEVSTVYDTTCRVTESTFENNTATANGGAVYLYGNQDGYLVGVFTSCEFNSNEAYSETGEGNNISRSGRGGAIYSNNADFNVVGGSFDSNMSGAGGGAIYMKDSAVSLSGLTAQSNSTYGNGGFVQVDSSTGVASALTVSNNSTIQENTAVYGGAIIVSTATSSAIVSNTSFNLNEASNNGGAIYVNYGTLTASNDTFTSNAAHSTSYGGGAIYGTNATINVSNTTLDSNTAKFGGAVCANTNSVVTLTNVTGSNNTVTNQGGFAYVNGGAQLIVTTANNGTSTISGNQAGTGGGAIYVTATGSLSISNTTLSSNTSNASGGALYLYCGSTNTITNCYFTLNSGTNGAAIISYGADFTVSGSTFTSNAADDWGGAIYVRSGANSEVPSVVINNNTIFSSNTAAYGGAIYANTNTALTLTNVTFNSNEATSDGAAVYVKSNITISNSLFTSNIATGKGGAVFFYLGSSAVADQNMIVAGFNNVNFTENSAANAGAVYANNVKLTINGGTYTGNSSTGDGGVMYIQYSNVNILSGTFTGNTSSGNGNFYINRSVFTTNQNGLGTVLFGTTVAADKESDGNTAQRGGVIYATVGSQVNLYNATFGYNSALASDAYGGAIHASGADSGSSTFLISNCTFVGNTSPNYGGAVGASNASSVTITNSTFESNTGKYGGAVAANNNATISIVESTFTSNRGTTYGGAIWCTGSSSIEVDDSAFTSNTAPNYGAVGCGGTSVFEITDSSFTTNSATSTATDNGNGGAIGAIATSTVTVDGCTFTSNHASSVGNGGAIYSATTSANGVTINNSNFISNTAKNGGSVAVNSGSNVEITSSIFDGNSSTSNGGSVYVYGSATVTIDGCDFSNGSAASGGAICANGGTVTLLSSSFDSNTATSNGGAIYAYASSLVSATNCEFTNCSAASGGVMRIGSSSTDNSYALFTGCTFTSNSATGNGGAAYIYTSNVNTSVFTGCTFTSNSVAANKNGGAFYISSATIIVLENTTMRNNSATKGNAIYISNGSGCTTNVTIQGTYTTLNNNIEVGTTATSVTITSSGLVSEDSPAKTWTNIVTGKTSVVHYI